MNKTFILNLLNKKQMGKKFITLSSVTLLSLMGIEFYYYGFLRNCDVRSTLFLKNIEALSIGDLDPSECPGRSIYSITGVREARFSSRTHSLDSMDVIRIFEARQCVAEGSGEMEGNDSRIISFKQVETKKEKCNGLHYQASIL